jgi:PAS domain S-box-containing protein
LRFPKLELPLRTTLLYLLFGGLWILLSDQILSLFGSNQAQHVIYQTLKGWFFILVSGSLLYILLRRDLVAHKREEQEIAWLASFPARNPNPVVEIDSTGAVFYMNPAAQQRFPDLPVQGFQHPWLAGLESMIGRFQHEGISELQRDIEINNEWYSQPIYYLPEAGRLRVYGTEITERIRAERQTNQMKRLYATLSQVNQTIVRVKDTNELYQALCDVAVKYGEFSLAWIGLLDETSGEIKPVAAQGLDITHWPFQLVNINRGPYKDGLVATSIRTSKVVTSENIQADKRLQNLQDQTQKYAYHSAAAIPFRLGGQIIGVLSLASSEVSQFIAEEEVHLLEEIGLDISFALDAMESEIVRKRAEERFASAFHSSPMPITITRVRDGKILDVNEMWCKVFGYTREQALGRTSVELDVTNEHTRQQVMATLKEMGVIRNLEARITTRSGEERDMLYSMEMLEINGEPHSLATLIDITERKRAEEALRERTARLKAVVENVGATLWSIDSEFRLTMFNSTYAHGIYRTLGHETRLGETLPPDLLPLSTRQEWKTKYDRALSGEAFQEEVVVESPSGDRLYWEYSFNPIIESDGHVIGVTCFGRDITQRKQAEEQIQRQLTRMNALRAIDLAISSSFDLHVILDVVLQHVLSQLGVDASALFLFNGQLRTIEYAASRGFRSDALHHTRLKLGEGYAGRAVIERKTIHISDLMATGGKLANSLLVEHESFVDYYGTPLIVKGEVKGVLEIYHRSHLKADAEWLEFLETLAGQAAIAIDNAQLFENLQQSNFLLERRVSERTVELNRTNEELEHANRAKDEFLANMSHELRTPLTSILGLSESLLEQRRGPLNDHQQRSLEVIESSGQHLLQLINDILDLSKIEARKFDYYPQPVSVDEVCRSSLSFVKSQAIKKSITVTYLQDISIARIFADPRRLKQILVNLLSNAVKFTPENGEVRLQVKSDPEQDLIKFSVIDNGIGIAVGDLQRLFQPFVQVDSGLSRQHEGTGLGLALVQKLTDLHGGSVQVESEVSKGSRFTVSLPCLQEEVVKLENLESQPPHPIRQRAENTEFAEEVPVPLGVILLADDNMPSVLTIAEYLESYAYEVVVAHDGVEAVEKAEAIHPDLILMDIQMPVMNGLEAIGRLRANARFADTPIIALTALAMSGDRERSLLAGANEYMTKPVSLKLLAKTINELLGKPE